MAKEMCFETLYYRLSCGEQDTRTVQSCAYWCEGVLLVSTLLDFLHFIKGFTLEFHPSAITLSASLKFENFRQHHGPSRKETRLKRKRGKWLSSHSLTSQMSTNPIYPLAYQFTLDCIFCVFSRKYFMIGVLNMVLNIKKSEASS